MNLRYRLAQRLGAWRDALVDYLAAPSAIFEPLTPPEAAPPSEAAPRQVVLVGGPFHLECFVLPSVTDTAALSLISLAHPGGAWYLRHEGELDQLGRERWHYDSVSSRQPKATA